jgi:GTP-binding nuclear protein Ran
MLTVTTRNPTLDFVAAPALAPAEIPVDAALMATYEAELKQVRMHTCYAQCLHSPLIDALFLLYQAEAVPLPEEDDDL